MDLICRLKEKEESALVELMDTYGNYLLRTAFLLVKDQQTAEEIVQDTFVVAFQKIAQLHEAAKIKSWLTMITINFCRARMRKWSWRKVFVARDEKGLELENNNADEYPEDALFTLMENEQLYKAIQELDYSYREAIILFYFNEYKVSEMAEHLNEKENTIKTRLARARAQLKGKLERSI